MIEPSPARIWNYWLGGFHNVAADRAEAGRVEVIIPAVRRIARTNRLFAGRAAGWAAAAGLPVLDLGCGLPADERTHDMARSVRGSARVVYVDHDPEVAEITEAMLGEDHPGLAVAQADIRDPAAVLGHPAVREVAGRGPVCLLFALSLHYLPPGGARDLVGEYARLAAAGSAVAITCLACDDPSLRGEIAAACTPARVHAFTWGEFEGLFGGLELVPPGIAPAVHLRPGWAEVPVTPPGPVYLLGGIARAP